MPNPRPDRSPSGTRAPIGDAPRQNDIPKTSHRERDAQVLMKEHQYRRRIAAQRAFASGRWAPADLILDDMDPPPSLYEKLMDPAWVPGDAA